MTTAVAILAAGGSHRLGRSKQLVEWRGLSLLQHAVDAATGVAPRVLLTLGADADALWRSLRAPASLERVDVPDHREGMSASLRAAVARVAAEPATQRLLVMLVDQYAVDDAWLRGLLALADQHPQRMIASRYDGLRGVPAVFPRSTFTALAALRGDQGARALLRGETGAIDFIAPRPPGDVDTPAQMPGE